MSFPTLEPVVLTQCGGQVPPSSTAFVHVCLAGVALPSCRVVTVAWLDRAPSGMVAGVLLLHRPWGACWSSSSLGSWRSEAWGRPARGCGGRQSCGWCGRCCRLGTITDGEEGLVHLLHERLRLRGPGSPDGTHRAARPVDRSRPHQEQLPGLAHGPCLRGRWPGPQDGHRSQEHTETEFLMK